MKSVGCRERTSLPSKTCERIQNFISEKFNVENIRELELRPADEESEEEDEDLTPKQKIQYPKIDDVYDIIAMVGAGGFGVVIACRDR